ncbi:uncharacterized protein LOC119556610 isoform X1 [Drosophila subpulchrella]|uniref:uncharacterized protein LOC119556610 isoform X1 n=2 Tax=Drosophila subpulchrella TaxID=1486046 RepID=UPI0018A13430|nr:uncharacterized protein LOC119556610 isoform X1 [Drosophila subpulchrella]
MSIKVYLPFNYYYLKKPTDLYGQVQINEDNVVAYYVLEALDLEFRDKAINHDSSNMRFLGSILNVDFNADQNQYLKFNMRLCFTYNSSQANISLVYTGITPEYLKHIKLILYEKPMIRNLFIGGESVSNRSIEYGEYDSNDCDFIELSRLTQSTVGIQNNPKNHAKKTVLYVLTLIADSPITIFKYIVENVFVNSIMVHTSIYKHFKEWQKTYDERSRPANIALDRILGIILMLILFSLATQPGDFLIQISHYVIDELYSLLKVLEGSPIGLKLNIHLNNFFLDCFKYHIELWSTFLDFIEPLVRQVFLAIGAFGCLGLTFQIALLVDLISIIGLHSHCFYIYTKVLYNVERKGLSVLWQVVRGNRYNILKGRTESHNYMNRQLYLATIFFSAILFLFPTTLVYYIVFAALKALTFATLSIFEFVRRQILSLPIEGCMKRVLKGCNDIDCLQIKDVSPQERAFLLHKNQKISVTVYKITAL